MEVRTDSFSIVEYLSIFTAFIYGYVATRFFSGWAAMINFRKSIRFSEEHLVWTVLTFGLLIDVWWGSWIKGNFISRHMALYYLSLLSPLILYVVSVILFPNFNDNRFHDLSVYFDRVRKRNYLVFIVLFLSFEAGRYYFKEENITDLYFNVAAIACAGVGYFSKEKVIHYIILAAGSVLLISHITAQQPLHADLGTEENFSLTEYLTIFIAFIYGSIASRFFSGWGIMISQFDRINFSKDHFAWTLFAFGLLLDFWTGSWPRERFISLNINYFILSLLVPIVFYVQTAVIFPVIKNGDTIDLREFFRTHKKLIYLLFGITIVANGITANLMEQRWTDVENLFRIGALILALFGVFTRWIAVEKMVLVLGWIMLILHTVIESKL